MVVLEGSMFYELKFSAFCKLDSFAVIKNVLHDTKMV